MPGPLIAFTADHIAPINVGSVILNWLLEYVTIGRDLLVVDVPPLVSILNRTG